MLFYSIEPGSKELCKSGNSVNTHKITAERNMHRAVAYLLCRCGLDTGISQTSLVSWLHTGILDQHGLQYMEGFPSCKHGSSFSDSQLSSFSEAFGVLVHLRVHLLSG